MTYRELLIGCGSRRHKIVHIGYRGEEWTNLTTLDINPDHKPDVVADLCHFPYPFKDDSFDEIHAYEVLEHTGAQGDYKFFFAQFSELWRILRPNGVLCGTCPHRESVWAWGDPSHTRIVQPEQFTFLSQAEYKKQVGVTPMSDFRYLYKADFKMVMCNNDKMSGCFSFALQAIKE